MVNLRTVSGLVALIACQLLSQTHLADAVTASPFPFSAEQADGAQIALTVNGDEWNHWLQDTDGYTVVETQQNGRRRYVYAGGVDSTGALVESSLEVGKGRPEQLGVPKGLRGKQRSHPHDMDGHPKNNRRRRQHEGTRMRRQAVQSTGTYKNLVVMVRFSDHVNRTLPDTASLATLFNNVGTHPLCPTGSVRDVWLKNSYGRLTIDSVLTGWLTVPQTEAYSSGGNRGLVTVVHEALRSALALADPLFDFKQFDSNNDGMIDMITFIHSGYAAEWGGTDQFGAYYMNRIWSHKWGFSTAWTSSEGVRVSNYHISPALWSTSGTAIGRIGVIAHETGHYLGLPDLYDTDNNGAGIGSWGLMANSWGFDNSQYYPPHLSAWSKGFLGYVTPTEISVTGVYYADAVEDKPQVFRINAGFPTTTEYLLIENRQNIAFDAKIPTGGSGLAIFHIDDAAGYSTQSYPGQTNWPAHYRVALKQADGAYNLEKNNNRGDAGDTYKRGGVGNITVLSSTTTPSTQSYQGNVLPLRDTGITITVLSASNYTMAFRVEFTGTPTTCGAAGVTCSGGTLLQSDTTCVTRNTCTEATCCQPACTGSNNGAWCNDTNPTTINDVCISAGVCQGIPATCSNTNVTCPQFMTSNAALSCTPRVNCDTATCCVSICADTANVGQTCDDFSIDTVNDTCTAAGTCAGVQTTCANTVGSCATGTLRTANCVLGQTCNVANCCAQKLAVSSVQVQYVLVNKRNLYRATVAVVDEVTRAPVRGFSVTGYFQANTWTESTQTATASSTSTSVTLSSITTWGSRVAIDRSARFCVTNVGNVAGYVYPAGPANCFIVQ